MADKDIKIGIKTTADTSGAKAAEEAIKKVSAATQEAEGGGFGRDTAAAKRIEAIEAQEAALKKAADATVELEEGLGKISEALEDVAESGEEANEQGSELDENVKNISRAQKAQALAQLAQAVGQIGGKFKEAASEVEGFDKEAAASLRQTGERIEQVTSAVSALALGFAVGGPVGAGVAAAAIGVGLLVNAFMATEVAAIKAAAAQKKAMDDTALASRDAAREAHERGEELSRDEIEKSILRQNDAIAAGLALIREQTAEARKRRQEEERILSAQDKLDLAEIDEAEAKGEITPEAAGKSRAAVEQGAVQRKRADEKKRAEEDAADARATAEKQVQAFTAAEGNERAARERVAQKEAELAAAERVVKASKAKGELTTLEDAEFETDSAEFSTAGQMQEAQRLRVMKQNEIAASGYTVREQMTPPAAAAADLAAAKKALDEEKFALEAARTAVESQAKTASGALNAAGKAEQDRDRTISTVDAVAGREDATTASRERERQIREEEKAASKKKQVAKDAARKKEQAGRESESRSDAAATAGRQALDMLPEGVVDNFRKAVERTAKGLQNGGQGGEVKELISYMERLADVVEKKDAKAGIKMDGFLNRLKRLEGKR